MVTVDSRTLKTKKAKGSWDEHLEVRTRMHLRRSGNSSGALMINFGRGACVLVVQFDLLSTTPLVEVSVWKSDTCLGWLQLPIAS